MTYAIKSGQNKQRIYRNKNLSGSFLKKNGELGGDVVKFRAVYKTADSNFYAFINGNKALVSPSQDHAGRLCWYVLDWE